jgi:prolyl-tRNA editing enzyme YbaK/EbsC (Cys-tRNA(Pro) deacylase)
VRSSVDVHNYLIERDIAHEVFAAAGRLRSPERIAPLLGLSPRDIGKVEVFDGRGGPVAAVIPAGSRADPGQVGVALGESPVRGASDTRAAELTGYLVESIPPAGLPKGFRIVIDRALDRDAVLYFPGGEARAVLKVRGKDLVRATAARVADIAAWRREVEEPEG